MLNESYRTRKHFSFKAKQKALKCKGHVCTLRWDSTCNKWLQRPTVDTLVRRHEGALEVVAFWEQICTFAIRSGLIRMKYEVADSFERISVHFSKTPNARLSRNFPFLLNCCAFGLWISLPQPRSALACKLNSNGARQKEQTAKTIVTPRYLSKTEKCQITERQWWTLRAHDYWVSQANLQHRNCVGCNVEPYRDANTCIVYSLPKKSLTTWNQFLLQNEDVFNEQISLHILNNKNCSYVQCFILQFIQS